MKKLIGVLFVVIFLNISGCAFIPLAAGANFLISAAVGVASNGAILMGRFIENNRIENNKPRPMPPLFLADKDLSLQDRQAAWDHAQLYAAQQMKIKEASKELDKINYKRH